VATLEIYGSAHCPYTKEMHDWLEWLGHDVIEYDVERDRAARERMRSISVDLHTVPVLVEEGRVVQIGWQGRGCTVE
jgi:glutaredoxin